MNYKLDSSVLLKKELCFYDIQTSSSYMEEYGFLNLGILYGLQGKTLFAKKTLKKVMELNPDNKLALVLLNNLEARNKKIPDIKAGNNEFCNCYINALSHFAVKEYDKSLLGLTILKKQTPNSFYVNYLLAEVYFAKQDYEKVISITTQVIKSDRADQYLYSLLVRSYINLNDIRNAKKFNTKLLKKYHKSALFNIHMALIKQQQGDYDAAIIKATKAKIADPDLSESYTILGMLLFLKGKKEQAYQSFLKATSANPICVISNMALWSHHYVKELFNASDKYEFNLRHSRFFNPNCYAEWGEVCIESKNYDQGLSAYLKAIQFDKKNDNLLTQIAYIYYYKSDLKMAKAYTEDALMINDENKRAGKLDSLLSYLQGAKVIVRQTKICLVLLLLSLFMHPYLAAFIVVSFIIIFLLVLFLWDE